MQEEKAKKKEGLLKKIGIFNLICITLFVGALLLSAAYVAYSYRHIPTHENGEHQVELPWVGENLIIRSAEFGWVNVKGNEWMAMKGITHTPFVKVNIDGTTGSGTLYIQFINSQGHYVGQPTTIVYRDGTFETIDRKYYHATGTEATAYAFPVFLNTHIVSANDQFITHFNDKRSPLWRVEISYLPADSADNKPLFLGYSTIQKKLYSVDAP